MKTTAVCMVDKKELEKALPEHIWLHAYPFIMSAYDDKDSISIKELMKNLYGVIPYENYEEIFNIICTEM